jgi:phage tail sheath protein FI
VVGHNLASDRVVFVTPGIQAVDTPTQTEVSLPGSYAAAAVAGLISTFDPEVSPTNKTLAVDALEYAFDAAHLTELVQARVLALEPRSGFRIVKGITTDTTGAFSQISIRRIVDYAKRGVRSAAEPYIGLLNDERVRDAMHATINSFLAEMLKDEMLESYDLDVSATREEEIQGIARVTMSLQPVFSIDFIVVDMFLG